MTASWLFDRVNHDSLMARVASRLSDKRVLKLIRAFLNPTSPIRLIVTS